MIEIRSARPDEMDRIRALPGVTTVSATCCVPLQNPSSLTFDIIGHSANGDYKPGWKDRARRRPMSAR